MTKEEKKLLVRSKISEILPFRIKEILRNIRNILLLIFCPRFYWTIDSKIDLMNRYIDRYNLNIFVETGTYLGDTIFKQKDNFKKIYSIELSEYYFDLARKRFQGFDNINLILGNSKDKLKDILIENDESIFFWLDGHYSTGLTAKAKDKETPILEELNTIFDQNTNKHKHVIFIDDARLFNGTHDYPKYKNLRKFIREKDPRYSVSIESDIIVCIISNTY